VALASPILRQAAGEETGPLLEPWYRFYFNLDLLVELLKLISGVFIGSLLAILTGANPGWLLLGVFTLSLAVYISRRMKNKPSEELKELRQLGTELAELRRQLNAN
jgi:uncharacterized membrane protein YfcA